MYTENAHDLTRGLAECRDLAAEGKAARMELYVRIWECGLDHDEHEQDLLRSRCCIMIAQERFN